MTSKKIKITYDLKVVLNKFKSLRFQLEKDWSSNRYYVSHVTVVHDTAGGGIIIKKKLKGKRCKKSVNFNKKLTWIFNWRVNV